MSLPEGKDALDFAARDNTSYSYDMHTYHMYAYDVRTNVARLTLEAQVVRTGEPGPESDDSLYRDALEVLILTAEIAKGARQATEQRLKAFGAEITAPQYRLLRQLQQAGSLTPRELSRRMMVEPATLTPMVDTLEQHGLLRRGADPRDRRRTPLELTEAGRERLDQAPFIHEDDPIARYLAEEPVEDRRTFLRQLRGLAEALHGDDTGVRHITDAVNAYFDFGRAIAEQQRTPRPQTVREEEEPSR